MNKWIKCSDEMPHEYYFAKLTGRILESASHEVLVTLEYKGGRRDVGIARTLDGVWVDTHTVEKPARVIAWMPMPEPFMGEENA